MAKENWIIGTLTIIVGAGILAPIVYPFQFPRAHAATIPVDTSPNAWETQMHANQWATQILYHKDTNPHHKEPICYAQIAEAADGGGSYRNGYFYVPCSSIE